MKKFRRILILCLVLCVALGLLSGCGGQLSAPKNLSVDIDNVLTWDTVDMASNYEVEITARDNEPLIVLSDGAAVDTYVTTSRRATLDLSNSSRFRLEEGDYYIRIKAVARTQNTSDSEWSDQYEFHKDYETGCTYVLINNGTEYQVDRAGRAQGDIVIEDYYRGKPVTAIADSAFRSVSRVTGIVLGSNIRTIGANAFNSCVNLTSVTLSEGLQSIGDSAFKACTALTEIEIPSTVEHIGDSAFLRCRGLTDLTINEGVKEIGPYAFSDCRQLTEITIPDSVETMGDHAFYSNPALVTVNIGSGITTINENAFSGCSALTTINFAEGSALKTVMNNAFSNCTALESVTLPEGTEDLGDYCFSGCTLLKEIDLPQSLTHMGTDIIRDTAFMPDANGVYFVDDWIAKTTVDAKATMIYLDSEIIPEGVRGIADFAFYGSPTLQSVALPANVKIVGKQAFVNCQAMMTLNTTGVEFIDYGAFAHCINLTTLRLGEGLRDIGSYAFYGCSSLNNNRLNPTSTIPASVRHIGSMAFHETAMAQNAVEGVIYAGNWAVGCVDYPVIENNMLVAGSVNPTVSLYVEDEPVVGIADYAFVYQMLINQVNGLENVMYMGKGAFYACQSLSQLTLSNDLLAIPDYAFSHCSSLFRINLSTRLQSIGKSAFYLCDSLNSIVIPDNVTEIGINAFNSCTGLMSVELGSGITEIPDYMFFGCTYLNNVVIPDSVTRIGVKAFGQNGTLNNVTIGNSVTDIDYAAFYKSGIRNLVLPDSVTNIGNHAFYKNLLLTDVQLSSGVENIGDYAFYGSLSLQKISLPAAVKSVGQYAFANSSVSSVLLPSDIENIGANAFYSTPGLTVYTDAESDAEGWNAMWNSSGRPVVYGCEFAYDGELSYVSSLTVTENTFKNIHVVQIITDEEGNQTDTVYDAVANITAPYRQGYTFVGWATSAGAAQAEYTAGSVINAPVGTTLYAVWQEGETQPEEPVLPDEPQPDETGVPDVSVSPDDDLGEASADPTAGELLAALVMRPAAAPEKG